MSTATDTPSSQFDRISQARTIVRELVRRRDESKEAGRYEERVSQLRDPAARASQAAVYAQVFSDHGVPLRGIDNEAIGRWRARLLQTLAAYDENTATILDPAPGENAKIVFFEPLRQATIALSDSLLGSWRAWVLDQTPAIPGELLQVLAGVPALNETVSSIRELQNRLRKVAEALPGDAGRIGDVKSDAAQLAQLWASISGSGIPRTVITFLRAAGERGGAAFSLLTPEVVAWMEQHALVESLRIRLS